MPQILTYPWETKYQRDGWDTQVKDGKGGSIPCSSQIFRGRTIQNAGGVQWYATNDGSDNASTVQVSNEHFEQPLRGSGQKGLAFWKQTSTDNYQQACWFDIGTDGGKEDGDYMYKSSRSSWLRQVTALWFMFNSHDTTVARGCSSQVEKAGIRYRGATSTEIRTLPLTEQIGEYKMGDGVSGGDKVMFGYALSPSDRELICRNNWRLLALRIQIRLERTGSGSQQDYIQGGVTGIRLGLGENYDDWNTTNKRALVLRGDTTYGDFLDNSKEDMLETR